MSAGLWTAVEPLLPPEPARPKGGRPRVDNRAVLSGIVYVLRSGIPWRMSSADRIQTLCSQASIRRWAATSPGER